LIRFSFVVPAHNEELLIERCLKSVFSQTYANYEVIVIDDGSKDRTSDLAAKYKVVLSRHEKPEGVVASLNEGTERAKGDVICFLGADDFVSSDYLERNVKAFFEPNVMGVSPIIEFEKPDSLVGKVFYYYRQIFLVKGKNSLWPMLWNRQVFEDIRFDKTLVVGEDADFWKQVQERARSKNWVFKYGTGVYYAAGQPHTLVTNLKSSFWYGLGFVKNCRKDPRTYLPKILPIVFFSGVPIAALIFLLTRNLLSLSWIMLFCVSFFYVIFKAVGKHNLTGYVLLIPLLLCWRALGHLAGILHSIFVASARAQKLGTDMKLRKSKHSQ
jgi:glycosyltransferase involved in cell wall biosynthesis